MNATEIIQRLGGPTKTAELCEVTTQAVSQWQHNGIPKARLKFLELARPDVFKQTSTTQSQPQ
ncbi:hypothetical protein AB595_04845 [Massilia sp. WF1]|uniref:Cro/CI family transcriptional regulator n=1 Tax=unclassified Massilia TaxID=2609279 RepID=UPI00064962AA|nr:MULTISPECIES: Cro/CI family transcriptional regulator [unclassified Massilia]ALK96997.1 hypothetical protein AM586_12760 [Massilia sp. WG5]KLU37946.1 hypothetical protein AB595_04845 [Massilia sp. WF1]